MIDYNSHIKKEAQRQQYWVEYYKKYNIEYTPKKGFDYIDVIYDFTMDEDEVIYNKAIEFLLSEFKLLTRNLGSYSQAMDIWIGVCNNQGIKCSRQNVIDAYNYAYGYGAEFEFTSY